MNEGILLHDNLDAAPPVDEAVDDEHVALIKSLATNNRFYALVPRSSGIRNADTIEEVPIDLLLGIAYPCLEDGLNDFAVIRTSYETLELFLDDEEMQKELMEMIFDARRNLMLRLMELLERILSHKAYFLGTDLELFKNCALDLMRRGFPRRNLDSMMKVNIFSSVEATEKEMLGDFIPADVGIYRYEFRNSDNLERLAQLSPHDFLLALFSDVLDSVLDDRNYESKYTFDCYVFQQFIALMFVSYASTDPVFYGTHKDDYGVGQNRSMDDTPLYKAVKRELRRVAGKPELPVSEARQEAKLDGARLLEQRMQWDAEAADSNPFQFPDPPVTVDLGDAEHVVKLPSMLTNEDSLLRPIASISALALQLQKHDDGDLSQLILTEASRLVQELKRLGIISPLAYDPGAPEARPTDGA